MLTNSNSGTVREKTAAGELGSDVLGKFDKALPYKNGQGAVQYSSEILKRTPTPNVAWASQ